MTSIKKTTYNADREVISESRMYSDSTVTEITRALATEQHFYVDPDGCDRVRTAVKHFESGEMIICTMTGCTLYQSSLIAELCATR